jgi:CheY-like chemotaxis protein/HPt (histidine-containing phosphotransfer) domain-containing protein
LSAYELHIETTESGFDAIDLIESGRTYDVIFMDHMMPQMDGIETTRKLRESGYTGTIVALTANALVGNEEMFRQNGFDGFISKPIDMRQLDAVLNRFIRDRYPDEAEKFLPKTPAKAYTPMINPKIYEVFCRDAKKAIVTLRETIAAGNLKLFTTTVHAMKSALMNVGENIASSAASELEKAGRNGDISYVTANTTGFIATLEAIIHNFSRHESEQQNDNINQASFTEDRA